MTSLYEVLKRSKTAPQLAPDMFTALWAKSIITGKIIELSGQVPLSFKANGTPLIDYTISGNTVQNGTPTPDNPIMPQGTGNRTGNLFDYTKTDGIIANKYINQRGSMVTDNEYYLSYPIKVNVGETYTWRFNLNEGISHTAPTVGFYDSSDNLLSTAQHDISIRYFSFEVPTNCSYIRASVFTRSNVQKEAMLNLGSTALPYEPYGQYKIPILSANTTTPVYLGEVETTRKVKKLVLTGEESWVKNDVSNPSNYLYYQTGYFANKTCVCSHLADMGTLSPSKVGIFNGNRVLYLNFGSAIMDAQPSGNTVAGLNEYLATQYAAGTPVTVWYVLATETTGIVNEPLMKIGNYADTLSMEQAGVQIPTNKGNTTLDVLTAVKPSNVSIKYRV